MIDLEDILREILDYMTETVGQYGGEDISRINSLIVLKNSEKSDELLELIPSKSESFVFNQRLRGQNMVRQWIDIAGDDDVKVNQNFDVTAKAFAISVHHLIRDNFSDDVFFASVRMGSVILKLMESFFKERKHLDGFQLGEIDTNSFPSRVSVNGNKALMSGVTYTIIIR